METISPQKSAFFDYVRNNIDEDAFNAWFKNIDLAERGTDIRILLPNSYVVSFFDANFRTPIEDAARAVFGKHFQVVFVNDPAVAARCTQTEQAETDSSSNAIETQEAETAAEPVQAEPKITFTLNSNYTFENYVVGPCNRLAHAAALAVTENPSRAYNPLFLHGSFGVGKSHLLQAICRRLIERFGSLSIFFLPCEEFINNFISALGKNQLEPFRSKYRNADVLVIDDIHFLAGKQHSQEEFFHTFNSLHNAEKQIILSSDAPAKDLPAIQERLVSRFLWGMEVRLEPPDYETRFAILRNKAEKLGFTLTSEIADYLANSLTNNIRELEGAVNNIFAIHSLTNVPISLDCAKQAIKDIVEPNIPSVRVTDIQEKVAKYFNLKLSDLQSKKRSQSVSLPRQIAIYLTKKLTSYSLEEIGGFFGGRDHSTMIHAVDKIESRIDKDVQFQSLINLLEQKIVDK